MGALFGAGLLLAGLIPPPSPSLGPHELADALIGDSITFRIGVLLMCISLPFYGLFTAGISAQIKRIEGDISPLANAELGFGMLNLMLALLAGSFLLTAAFRDRPDQVIQMFSDMAWLPLIALWMPAASQWLVTALAIFCDDRDDPILPRWAGYASLWVVTLTFPSTIIFFVHSGPFAWNGIIGFWLTVTAFFAWIVAMTIALVQAAKRQTSEPRNWDDRAKPTSDRGPGNEAASRV